MILQHPNPFVFHFYAAGGQDFKSSLVFVPPARGEGVDDPKDKTAFKSQHFLEAVDQLKLQIKERLVGGLGTRWCWIMPSNTPATTQKKA